MAQETQRQKTIATKPTEIDDNNVYPMTYRLSDLPVWTKQGEYNPQLLIDFIQVSVSPKTWATEGGPSTMAVYPKGESLVVSTTSKNHQALQKLLERFRH